jgi:endoglucanase
MRHPVLFATLAAITVAAACGGGTASPGAGGAVQGLHVRGDQIVNSSGQAVRLLGFNNSGGEYACEQGWGIFDAPGGAVTDGTVTAMAAWTGANAVRVPVNEQCWLGLPGVKPAYAGATYRQAIEQYVSFLNAHGFAVILDLARTAPGTERSANQEPMPDSHSPAFWRSAAAAFRDNTSVAFDLFNEPFPDDDADTDAAWSCWRDGGCMQTSQNGGVGYRAVGMQQLIDAVRATGARNVVIAEGIQYAQAVDQWLAREPHDPDRNLVASVHLYSFNQCSSPQCYNGDMKSVATHVPLLIGELGPDLTVPWSPSLNTSCPSGDVGSTGFDSALLSWARQHQVSWTAWSWNPWGNCWSLVHSYGGAPTTPYGAFIKSALAGERQAAPA